MAGARCVMLVPRVSVAARDHLRQAAVVVGHHQRQSVEFPREPNGAPFGPFRQFGRAFRLGQREGRKFVFLLLPRDVVFRDLCRRRAFERDARLAFHFLEFVEESVPFVVGHEFALSVVVGLRSLVQLVNPLTHESGIVVHPCGVFGGENLVILLPLLICKYNSSRRVLRRSHTPGG